MSKTKTKKSAAITKSVVKPANRTVSTSSKNDGKTATSKAWFAANPAARSVTTKSAPKTAPKTATRTAAKTAPKRSTAPSKTEKVLKYLQSGKSLTQTQCSDKFDAPRLSAIVYTLRSRNFKIESNDYVETRKDGSKVTVARYSFKK